MSATSKNVKMCNECGLKPAEPRKQAAWNGCCRECGNARWRRHRAKHPDEYRERERRARRKNPGRFAAKDKRYRSKNRDRIKLRKREYAKTPKGRASQRRRDQRREAKNPNRRASTRMMAHARERGAQFVEYVSRDEIIKRDKSTCYLWCKRKLKPEEVILDHVIPLPVGSHTKDNLKVACVSCNTRKGSKRLFELDLEDKKAKRLSA